MFDGEPAMQREARHIAHERSQPMEVTSSTLGNIQLANRTADRSPRAMARFAGLLYLVIAIAAIIAHMYVPAQLMVPGDAAATANNILASKPLFRIGIGSELVVLLCEVVLSIILYVIFKPVNKTLSLIAAVFRLAMTTIHAINLLNYFFVLLLLSGADYLAVFEPDQLHALVLLFLNAHSYGFTIGIACFAPHVLALGYLIFRSGYLPRILGILFMLAACGYFVDSSALLLVPSYDATPIFLALPIGIAEIVFPVWLLIKGVNVEQWKKRALGAAY
jgi:hypothetical protein